MAIYNPNSNQHSDGIDSEISLNTKIINIPTSEEFLEKWFR